ncbi:MAG: ferritin-like domain-containing protein [Acidimicrobiales bacterium]
MTSPTSTTATSTSPTSTGPTSTAPTSTGVPASTTTTSTTVPAHSAAARDIETLQTAAAIENLAVLMYGQLRALASLSGPGSVPFVLEVIDRTRADHVEHAVSYNATITTLHGRQQQGVDPVLDTSLISPGLAGATTAVQALTLASKLENISAQTYVANLSRLTDTQARKVTASVAGVEAQHLSVLAMLLDLLNVGLPPGELSTSSSVPSSAASALPASVVAAALTTAFLPLAKARDPAEGVVG